MGIYILAIAFVSALGLVISLLGKRSKSKDIIFLILAFTVLGLIMVLRDRSVGTDANSYCRVFEKIRDTTSITRYSESAYLYALYNLLVSFIFKNPQWIIVFNGLIITVGIAIFIYKNSENPVISTLYYVLFYWYFTSFNISRQYIAVILIINAYSFVKEKRLIPAAIITIIAIFIHNTAIVGAIFLIFIYLKLNEKNMIRILTLLCFVPFVFNYGINIFMSIFPRYKMYIIRLFVDKYEAQGRRIIITFIYMGVVAVALSLLKKKKNLFTKLEEEEMRRLICIISIGIAIGIVSINSALVARIEVYFSIFAIILIPSVIERFGKFRYGVYYVSILVMLIPCYIQLEGNLSGVNPYKFFF